MLDFAHIGGVYEDNSEDTMSANVVALNDYLADVDRPALRFGGPRSVAYGDKRVPGTAYFNGTIQLPDQKPVLIDGANCVLKFETIKGNTEAIYVGTGGSGMERTLENFELRSNGSGIKCGSPGRGTILRNIRIHPVCSGGTQLSFDDWTDRDTAGFGLMVVDARAPQTPDGLTVENVQIFDSGGHGFVIYNQLNAGAIRGRCHNAAGSGFKAENMHGCRVDIVSEWNYAWGAHLRGCGMGRYGGKLSGGNTDRPNDMQFWFETNNWRGSSHVAAGHGIRQFKVEKSGSIRLWGHTGWASNKADTDEGSRVSCQFISGHIPENVRDVSPPIVDLNTMATHTLPDANERNHNFSSVWPVDANRPTVATFGSAVDGDQGFRITFPPSCFEAASGPTAYWRPWGLNKLFTSQEGDVCIYEIELSGDANLVEWCLGRETVSTERQLSNMCSLHIAPLSGGIVWPGLYNRRRRKFFGRLALEVVRADVTPAIVLWADGYQDRTGSFPQNKPLELTIHSWKFYVYRADGSTVP